MVVSILYILCLLGLWEFRVRLATSTNDVKRCSRVWFKSVQMHVCTCMHVVGLQQPTASKLPHVAVQSFCQPPFVKLQRPFQFPLPLLPQSQFSFFLVYAPGRLSLYSFSPVPESQSYNHHWRVHQRQFEIRVKVVFIHNSVLGTQSGCAYIHV